MQVTVLLWGGRAFSRWPGRRKKVTGQRPSKAILEASPSVSPPPSWLPWGKWCASTMHAHCDVLRTRLIHPKPWKFPYNWICFSNRKLTVWYSFCVDLCFCFSQPHFPSRVQRYISVVKAAGALDLNPSIPSLLFSSHLFLTETQNVFLHLIHWPSQQLTHRSTRHPVWLWTQQWQGVLLVGVPTALGIVRA